MKLAAALAITLALSCAARGGEVEAAAPDRRAVVAVVDGEEIGRQELESFIAEKYPGKPTSAEEKSRIEEQALEALVNRRLVRTFLDGRKVEIDPDLLFEAKLYSYLRSQIRGPRTAEEAQALAARLHKQLLGGEDFAALARRHSAHPSARKGGDLGDFAPTAVSPEISKAVGALEVGKLSDVVEAGPGLMILQRTTLEDPAGEEFGNLRASLILVRTVNRDDPRRIQEAFTTLIRELREKSKIEERLAPAPSAPKEGPEPAPAEESSGEAG